MKLLRRLITRLTGLLPNKNRENDLSAELEAHVSLATDANLHAGMNPIEARRRAIQELGGLEHTRQAYRESATLPLLEDLLHDLTFAVRQLRKNLGFTVTAVLMLALGTCAAVSIFAFVDAALLKPLPYKDPAQLVGVFERVPLFEHSNLSYPDYLDWKRDNTVFSSLQVYTRTRAILPGSIVVPISRISDGFFSALGVKPILGRDFLPGEDLPSAPRGVLLSFTTWQKRYAGRTDVLGQVITINAQPHTILGVLPQDFQFAPVGNAEFWLPLHPQGSCDLRRSCHSLFGIGRLKPGVTPAMALADVTAIARHLEELHPQENRDQGASIVPLTDFIVGDIRPILLLLLAGAALLLFIACINVASLLLVRSESRRREIAIRGALGASPARLTRQFITEALLLVATGATLGLILAVGAMHLLLKLIPASMLTNMPYLDGLGLTPRVFAFALLLALAAVVVFSITPTLRLSLKRIQQGLGDGGRGASGATWRRFGSNLVILELATAMVLLVAAGLLGKSFYLLVHVDLGFRPDHIATMTVSAPEPRYSKDEPAATLADQLLQRTAALPGVQSVAISTTLPLHGGGTDWVLILGRPWHGEHLEMHYLEVSPAYLTTLGATLSRGRFFTASDTLTTPRVAVINQAFAKTFFPGEDPIGRQLAHTSASASTDPPMLIIGIVDDIREGALDKPFLPVLYYAFSQSTETYFHLIVRTAQPPQTILPTLATTIHAVDPDLTVADSDTMTSLIADSPTAYIHRSTAWLVGAFAVTALLLGIVGLYGVVAYSVSQRTREIGVRMALGAQRATVYTLILREAGWLAAAGIGAGLIASIGAATLMKSLLFGTRSWDIPTLAAVATLLALSAFAASFLPAHRAASINPVDALRAE
jgi:macrolide transport system ATP-binding/permease protein